MTTKQQTTSPTIRTINCDRINPAPYNPRKDLRPDDPRYKQLLASIEQFGCVEPLVWNRRTGHLVSGHQRFKILLARGEKQLAVSVVDFPLTQEKALNLRLNKTAGQWDNDKLTQILAELTEAAEIDVELTGFDLPEVEQLLAGIDGADGTGDETFDPEEDLARETNPITQPGELIELRPHRLLCGDATKPANWAKLMGDRRAKLMFTDPPYNVDYSTKNRPSKPKASGKTKRGPRWDKIRGDRLSRQRYDAWLKRFVAAVSDVLAPGAVFYIWNGHANFGLMHESLRQAKLKPACVLTWAKESFSPNFGDYNEQTEFCLYGWKTGARHAWYGPPNASTLWNVRRDRTGEYHHPTQKALELADRAVRNSSRASDIVVDGFLGSGTTLIAVARLGRSCYGMEIEPKYCDTIIRRFIALAGESAVAPEIAERYRIDTPKEVIA